MATLKNKQSQIPHGYRFILNELNWKSQPYASFDTIVNQAQAVIRANPEIAKKKGWPSERHRVADWVEQYNVKLCQQNGWKDYIIETAEDSPPKWVPPAQAVRLSGRLAAGAKSLLDWLGDGAEPVPGMLSEYRAAVCVKCPLNEKGELDTFFIRSVSEIIRKQIGFAKSLNLSTIHDDKLGVCAACSCPLKLKVHVPLQHILDRIPGESYKALHEQCWIRKENDVLSASK